MLTDPRLWTALDIVGALVNLLIAGVVYTRGRRPDERAFAFLTLCLSLWTFTHMMVYPRYADPFWMRALFTSLAPLPAAAWRFARGFARRDASADLVFKILAGLGGLSALTTWTPLFDTVAWRIAFTFFFFPALFSSVGFFVEALRKTESPGARNSLLYLCLGSGIAACGGFVEFLPHFGVRIPAFPFGSLSILIYTVMISYAILRHDLLDIARLARRGLFLAAATTGVALLAVLVTYLTRRLPGSQLVNTVLLLYLLVPLLAWAWLRWGRSVKALFFEDDLRREAKLEEWIRGLYGVRDAKELDERARFLLRELLGAESVSLLLARAGGGPRLSGEDRWQSFFRLRRGALTRTALDAALERAAVGGELEELADLKRFSDSQGAEALIPVYSGEETAGLLIVGPSTWSVYDAIVMGWLSRVGATLGQALQVQRVYHELLNADRLVQTGALALGIAHEIRNPLTYLKGSVQVLRDPAVTAEKRNDILKRAESEFDRLNKLVDEILSFGKPSPPARETIDAAAVLDEIARLLRPNFQLPMQFMWTRPAQGVPMLTDKDHLKQIVINLARNAEFALRQAGQEDGKITLALAAQGSTVFVQVADNGPGIPQDLLSKLFEPFATGSESGNGLGLAMVERLARLNGGRVWVQSQSGQGTIFTVELPSGAPA